MAGLLTYVLCKHLPDDYQWFIACTKNDTYSSGTVQDSHLIPFLIIYYEPITAAKLQKDEQITKRLGISL